MEQKLVCDDRLDVARRLYYALCAQYPDRFIILCDARVRVVNLGADCREPKKLPLRSLERIGTAHLQRQLRQLGEGRRLRRASSLASNLVAERRPNSSSK
jgi:hypothetical protein